MIKNLKFKMLTIVGLLLTAVALTGASTSSIWYLYEPEVPKFLKNGDRYKW